jgi:predicted house-cleaning noncanonical NTP pyrophosphatase (MazG superfamily)
VAMHETIQEILKKYGEYPSDHFPHIEWLKERLLELDDEIEEIQQDRNRFLTELCKAKNTINQLRVDMDGLR